MDETELKIINPYLLNVTQINEFRDGNDILERLNFKPGDFTSSNSFIFHAHTICFPRKNMYESNQLDAISYIIYFRIGKDVDDSWDDENYYSNNMCSFYQGMNGVDIRDEYLNCPFEDIEKIDCGGTKNHPHTPFLCCSCKGVFAIHDMENHIRNNLRFNDLHDIDIIHIDVDICEELDINDSCFDNYRKYMKNLTEYICTSNNRIEIIKQNMFDSIRQEETIVKECSNILTKFKEFN